MNVIDGCALSGLRSQPLTTFKASRKRCTNVTAPHWDEWKSIWISFCARRRNSNKQGPNEDVEDITGSLF